MQCESASIRISHLADVARCEVAGDAPLASVFRISAVEDCPYLFVVDESGNPQGVISINDILERVRNRSPAELIRWLSMPVELALQSRLDITRPDHEPADPNRTSRATLVSRDDRPLGLFTEDDLLISWRVIEQTLRGAHGDCVTGLPNRSIFERHLRAECNRASRHGHSVAVILVDLDFFKKINDTWGHAAGDEALKVLGRTLRSAFRSYDLVARFGGDEFGVVCSACLPGEIDRVVGRLQALLENPPDDENRNGPPLRLSIGAAVAHDVARVTDPATAIVEAADTCLYAAKEGGRNCAFKWEFTVPGEPEPVRIEQPDE